MFKVNDKGRELFKNNLPSINNTKSKGVMLATTNHHICKEQASANPFIRQVNHLISVFSIEPMFFYYYHFNVRLLCG